MAHRVLIVDDEAAIRDALRMILEYEGYEVAAAATAPALAELERDAPGRRAARHQDAGHGRPRGARPDRRPRGRAARPHDLGPRRHRDRRRGDPAGRRRLSREAACQRERVLVSVRNALSRQPARGREPSGCARGRGGVGLVGESRAMRRLREEVARAAPTSATVLILGESGTGKELVARGDPPQASQVARARSCRSTAPRFREELIESELFGHEKGSFTGAVRKQIGKFVEADGGTIFLDEVGDMSARSAGQGASRPPGRRGRAGRRGAVGPASTCASSPRPTGTSTESIRAGRFREDLYFRLNVIPSDDAAAARAGRGHSRSGASTSRRVFSERDHRKPRRFAPSALGRARRALAGRATCAS